MKKVIGKVLIGIAVMMLGCITVCGAELESVQKNMVLETVEEVELREEPSSTGAVITSLQAGTVVVVSEDASRDWCKVSYREQEGYVKISQTIQLAFEEIMAREHEEMQARIWGSIIVVLIVAIFGVGIVSAVKKNKEESKEENS